MEEYQESDKKDEPRHITLTEKGLSYQLDLKGTNRYKRIKVLNVKSDGIRQLLLESLDTAHVKTVYADWLSNYEDLLFIHGEYQNLLPPDERPLDEYEFQKNNSNYLEVKKFVEEWFSKYSYHPSASRASSRSSRSSSRTSRSSQLSQAKIIESQRKVELETRFSALADKQAIEHEKLKLKEDEIKLKFKEEELDIKTELRVSDAKTKVLDDLERSELLDRELEDYLAIKTISDRYYKTVQTESTPQAKTKGLNPTAAEWKSGHLYNFGDQQDIPNISQLHSDKVHDIPSNVDVPHQIAGIVQPVNTPLDSNKASGGILTVARELNKPKAEIQKFDGSPMEYNRFLRQFKVRIEANTESYDERLSYLMQFTSGEAHKIVLGFSHLDAKRGYLAALEEFKDRYGDPDVVAHAYVKKALDWPVVKPDRAKSLDEYAIFLRECQFAVENVEAARVLEYSENLKLLVKKLPYYLHEKWRNIVYNIKEKKETVKFKLLVDFVRKEAKKAVDPVYGKDVMSAQNIVNKQSNNNQFTRSTKFTGPRKNFATSAVESPRTEKSDNFRGTQYNVGSARDNAESGCTKPCLYCQGPSHSLDSCKNMYKQLLKDRYAFLKSKELCFGCLRTGHHKLNCRRKATCERCNRLHPTILHVDPTTSYNQVPVQVPVVTTSDNPIPATSASCTGAGTNVHQALPIVAVRIKSTKSDNYIETYAFLDSGSTATFCTENIMRSLNIEGKRMDLNLITMGENTTKSSYVLSDLEISDIKGDNVIKLPQVFTQRSLPVTRDNIVSHIDLGKWPELLELELNRIDADVELLIGINVPKAMEPWDVIPSNDEGPYAVKTLLGWVINGPMEIDAKDNVSCRFVTCNRIDIQQSIVSLEEQMHNNFNYDFSERNIDDIPESSKKDKQFLKQVSESIEHKDGHYTISLPFKSKPVNMPNNRKQAEARLASIIKRFTQDQQFYTQYKDFMENITSKGYAQKVSQIDTQQSTGNIWYLPHHGVYHPRKNKLRVVFDCAARYGGTSLNEQLLQGPNLTNTLVGTLIRFRQEPVAIMGDIDSMFYQVRVPPEEVGFLRFLWWENSDYKQDITEYQMNVHLFGATSSPSCANYALRQTAQDWKGHFDEKVIDTVLRNFYVDDCLKSVETVSDGTSMVKDVQTILKKGGFRIAKWISNSREIMNQIPVEERAKEVQDLDLDFETLPIDRALGVQWCVETDTFEFKVAIKEQPFTRRGILSAISSVFDPLGFIAPFVLKAKILSQTLCKLKLGWDDKIPEEYAIKWSSWLQDIQKLSALKVNRCIKPSDFGTVQNTQIHHFSDASKIGYGTATYLRLENTEGKIHCSLIMGKSRVTPLKEVSIPRLELTAATVAVRTNKMIQDELQIPIDKTLFWTDSMCVLRYIRNDTSRFHTFVANRLSVIQEGSTINEWKYVNTKLNPADSASRGLSMDNLEKKKQWFNAPEFLWNSEEQWPQISEQNFQSITVDDDPELRKEQIMLCDVQCVQNSTENMINYHSSWFTLKRSVAWILKIRAELLKRVRCKKNNVSGNCEQQNEQPDKVNLGQISLQDMNNGEKSIMKFVQKTTFANEIDSLQGEQKQVKQNSSIKKLDPIMDEGLLRVGGRLQKSSMPSESKHPIILPKGHHVSTLVLREMHEKLKHSGRNHMLSHLRQRYWLINAPSAIRKLISDCVVCRKQRSKVSEQKMADLPEDRVTPDEPPFTRVGVDYFGPFEVKQRRCRVKRYGVIFTCLTSRAVHLEVAVSLDTDSYINALRRFIARRGQVSKMRSDNGTNFVGANHELKREIEEWNLSQIHHSMLQKNVDWQFNPPAGSHHGGVWERLIRSVRKIMNSVVKEQTMDDEGLHTLMCEIEATINSRPITKGSDHHCDLEALTPNHLLLMKTKPSIPPGVFSKTDNYGKRRWRQVQYMANLFWNRWIREYLPLLQERQKWLLNKRNMEVGDIVLVVDHNAPRNSWPMGKVLETIPDSEGVVRQVKVRTSTNTLIRPITKLCLILETD